MPSLYPPPFLPLFNGLLQTHLTCPANKLNSILAESGVVENNNRNGKQEKCEFYLAESSIPNSGLGVYTAVPFEEGQEVGEPDIFIPLLDADASKSSLLHDFVWEAEIIDELLFESYSGCEIFSPGLRAHINSHFKLSNVEASRRSLVDPAGLHRSRDPGSGAFTRHHNLTSTATTFIEAGSELFADYGDDYFMDRASLTGPVPLKEHFQRADRIVDEFMSIRRGSMLSSDWWDLILSSIDDERLLQAVPKSMKDVKRASNVGTARAGVPGFVRTPEWLEENALCIDNIRAGRSTKSQAGRGAFAKRYLSQGSVIAPAPIIHFTRESMHKTVYKKILNSDAKGKQLLLNYCIGHPQSDVLLLPYSPVVNLINHDSEPNAEIRWSTSRFQNSGWLNLSQNELLKQETTGLMIEYIALTDISAGEEILIDYGPIWESAWEQHLLGWVPMKGSENYTSAVDFSKRHGGDIRTVFEQQTNPYPGNIKTACYFMPPELLEGDDDSEDVFHVSWTSKEENFFCLLPCLVISKTAINENTFVTAAVGNARSKAASEECTFKGKKRYIVEDIPEHALKFVDSAYTSDQHIPNAFRHEIGAAEDFFPPSWKGSDD